MTSNRSRIAELKLCAFFVTISLLVACPMVLAGPNDDTVSGKVILYEPDKKIVIVTISNNTKEFTISPETVLQDVNGNRTSKLDLKKDFSVRIQTTGSNQAMNIRPTPDVGGPEYNPTPNPKK